MDCHKPYQRYGPLQAIHHQSTRIRTIAWPARSAQRGKHKSHPHTASPSLIIHYTRQNAYTEDEIFKNDVVIDSLVLKYRHIYKNDQQKTFSAKRPSKNGQKMPNGQPKNRMANQLEIRPNFTNFGKTANHATLDWMTMSILWSEWRWAFSFYGVENCLLLRIMCGTKRLNSVFRVCKASEVLHKYAMWVCSDNFTAAFFLSFNVNVFVADIERIQSKVICLWIGTTACSVNITSTCSQWRN